MKRLIKELPILKQLWETRRAIIDTRSLAERQSRLNQELLITTLLGGVKYADPKKLNRHEAQIFSQYGEDGIIAEIFSRIGSTSRIFVEFGAGDGIENNSAYLVLTGWSGYWFEGDNQKVDLIRSRFADLISGGRVTVAREFFTAETAPSIFQRHHVPEEFDLLSIDIDRNTSWIWRTLGAFRPRVCVIEYNASIPPQDEWEIPYQADEVWDGTLLMGASLVALERIATTLGYSLVGCDLAGADAFFVRNDLVANLFSQPFTALHHYEPPRFFLGRTWGHKKPERIGAGTVKRA